MLDIKTLQRTKDTIRWPAVAQRAGLSPSTMRSRLRRGTELPVTDARALLRELEKQGINVACLSEDPYAWQPAGEQVSSEPEHERPWHHTSEKPWHRLYDRNGSEEGSAATWAASLEESPVPEERIEKHNGPLR